MANVPLVVLTGAVKIGANAGAAVDVNDAVLAVTILGNRDTIEIPPTFATGNKSQRGGASAYSVQFDYLPDDLAADTMFLILWDALDPATNPTGELYFEALLHEDAAVGADNPKWSGTFIATEAGIGGASNEVSRRSSTFPLIARPTHVIV